MTEAIATLFKIDSCDSLPGTLPSTLGGMRSLVSLDFSQNKLTGTLPWSLGDLPVKKLDFGYNGLNGTIPNSFANFTNASIYLASNKLTGTLGIPSIKLLPQ
jgi:hypothetical protein